MNLSRDVDITLDSTPRRAKRRRDSIVSTPVSSGKEKWIAFEGFGDNDDLSSDAGSIEVERARAAPVLSTPQRAGNLSFEKRRLSLAKSENDNRDDYNDGMMVEDDDMMLPPPPPMDNDFDDDGAFPPPPPMMMMDDMEVDMDGSNDDNMRVDGADLGGDIRVAASK